MTKLQDFNINELMLFIVGVLGAFGGLCVIIQKSKCKKISICGMGCERDTDLILKEEKLQMTGHTGDTPKPTKTNLELVLNDTPDNTNDTDKNN